MIVTNQAKYLRDLLKKCRFEKRKAKSTPMSSRIKLDKV